MTHTSRMAFRVLGYQVSHLFQQRLYCPRIADQVRIDHISIESRIRLIVRLSLVFSIRSPPSVPRMYLPVTTDDALLYTLAPS